MKNDNVNDNMSMTLYWSCQCSFIFQSWTCQNVFPFMIACLICLVVGGISLLLPVIKKWLQRIHFMKQQQHVIVQQQSVRVNINKKQSILTDTNRQKSQQDGYMRISQVKKGGMYSIFLFLYYLLFSTFHVTLMLLIMTMNGYVVLSILFGMTLGYYINLNYQGIHNPNSQTSTPVNCAH